jgi:ATP-dependent RNA helicase SUPV3L1/SUV3
MSRHVTAVLGPTNTGKTHLAIERMLGHQSGLIGLPLRLLAREVYDRIVARVGARDVALITGEEKIKPDRPRYYVCTVEAMPRDVEVDFLAVDEIQLAADPDRGHVFTDRLFSARGTGETLLLGAGTMAETIRDLIPGANFISRPRLSRLTYAGLKKITRLPSRSAIVAFSANDVYAIAELIRRQRGGAAVVMGALSPRTRNAQVALYQSGEVDFLVATDAVGMGLNLDVDHVAFAGTRKFDGRNHRDLTASELGQIAGRAGRHLNDGTFGVTGDVEPLDPELVNKLENHDFEPVRMLQWRNTDLDFASLDRLKESLKMQPGHPRLARARSADDLDCLDLLSNNPRIREIATAPAAIKRLWEVCQVPDYRKVAPATHAELAATLYGYLMSDEGLIPEDWFAAQVDQADRTDGDIDTLSTRIAHIRTWTFVSNRREWLKDPDTWQAKTREIEDRLSDALHEQLTQRFVDKRTSVLMKSMRDKDNLFAEIDKDGRVVVEKHYVGKLEGFRFTGDAAAAGVHGKAARNAAAKVLVHELAARADRLAAAPDSALALTRDGRMLWEFQELGRIVESDDPLKPSFTLYSDEHLAAADKDTITKRVEAWLQHHIEVRLKPLIEVARAEDVTGLAKGIAFRLKENFGIVKRDEVAAEVKSLDQEGRAQLRKYGVRFGAHNIYFPLLLKPASADMLLQLWLLKNGAAHNLTMAAMSDAPRQGLTSVIRNPAVPDAFYRAAGYQVCGQRAVRIDMLERLADLIRPLTSWKPTEASPNPPPGAVGNGGFKVKPEMMSILGCSAEELGTILESLGFRKERRPLPRKPVEIAPAATETPASVPAETEAASSSTAPANDNLPSSDAAHQPPVEAVDGAVPDVQTPAAEAAPADDPSAAMVPAPNAEAQANAPQVIAIVGEEVAGLADGEAAASVASAESATADAPAAPEAPAPQAAAADSPAEPEFEEIWRFRRPRPQGETRERSPDHRHRPGQRPGERREGGDGKRPFSHRGPRPDFRPRGDGPKPVAADGSAAPQTGADGEKRKDFPPRRDRPHDRDRQHRPHDRRDQKPDGAATPVAAQGNSSAQTAPAQRPNPPRNDGRRFDNRNQGRPHQGNAPVQKRQFAATAAPKSSGGAVDPDSPFAALSKLKDRLEGKAP